jgi:hypothetical protein
MPFQNAPANGGCGAKISRDEPIVVRYNKKLERIFHYGWNILDFL